MTDSSQTQDNKSPGDRHNSPAPNTISASFEGSLAADKKSEVITEKFLTVAKEKSHLESIIMSQNDIIAGLEHEKEKLTLSLKKFNASHKSMKEKLLDFDILRNMEISELKKKIEQVMAENKKMLSEKDSILRNLERDQLNISRIDNQVVKSLMKEKRELEEQLAGTLGKAGAQGQQSILEIERELSLARSEIAEIGLDRDEARAELYNVRVEFDHLKADKVHIEENLQQKVHDYSKEIAELKTDVDELTSAIESKIHFIDELNAKVVRLSGELSLKDSELHEKIPALLDKINSLSQSIDIKMEENSLFSKELFDLNVKLSTLNEEMIGKDELLIDISEDYKKQKDEIEALHGAHELTLKNLLYERDLLKYESEDLENRLMDAITANKKLEDDTVALRNVIAQNDQQINDLVEDLSRLQSSSQQAAAEHADTLASLQEQISIIRQELSTKNDQLALLASAEAQAAEKDRTIAEIQERLREYEKEIELSELAHADRDALLQEQLSVLNQQLLQKNKMLDAFNAERLQALEKDQAIAELRKELLLYQSNLQEATSEHASNLAALREKVALLNRQLLEKQELLTVMASEREREKNEFLYQTDLFRKEKTHRDDEISRLMARGLEQENNIAEHISQFDRSQKEKVDLEQDLAQAVEKINELVIEQDRLISLSTQNEQALSGARAEISVLQESVTVLQASQAEIEMKMRERQEIFGLATAEKEELLKADREYRDTFEHLKQEIISLNRNLAEKEQTIHLLLAEKDDLVRNSSEQKQKLDQSRSSIADLQAQLNESRHNNNRFSAAQDDLEKIIARLQGEISSLTRTKEEEMKTLRDDLSSYGRAAADLRLKLEQSLNENAELRSKLQVFQSAGPDVSIPVIERREETLPARVEIRASSRKSSFVYTLLALFLLGAIGFSFYAFNTGLFTLPVWKPAAREKVIKELAYNDMFSLLTKTSALDDFKFQATLLTEALVLKSDTPGEKALFDFQNHLYFKVSISAPKEGLNDKMADDPYPMITLTVGTEAVKPLSHIHVKDIKIFYRKEEPVSIMFYCAFPRTALTNDRNTLSLSFKTEKRRADVAWDLKSLSAGNLFP